MVQSEKFKIGLNEIPMGIMVPPSIQELYISAIGYRLAYQYLLESRLHSAQEALKIGLVDAVIPRENLEHACTEKMHHYLQADSETFGCAKQNMRLMLLKRMQDADSMAVESIENHFWKPSSQSRLQTILKGLSKSN